ncbi:MAG TPA: AAA family ATPase [Nitrospiria bacterium]|nr:AAA family ATPase [Nitrospiria bacterium]
MTDALIQALQDPALYDHPVDRFEVIETHISWVLLTGPYAYKLKKPVDFGFVNFTTLERRKFFCGEELRLNQRLAPAWYLDVVPITGTVDGPRLRGAGPAIEYAVKMKQFPQDARLDLVLARGALTPERLDAEVSAIAEFHGRAAVAAVDSPFGTPERIANRVQENLATIREHLADPGDLPLVERLDSRARDEHAALARTFAARKRDGFIRECHGDLHLGNMAWVDGRPLIFDCIEFNDDLRWIDVMSEFAFLVMDLDHRDAAALARRALNAYLEATGDYAGLRVLPYYYAYRSLVRAKVACLRLRQGDPDPAARAATRRELRGYLDLAAGPSTSDRPVLIMTHGVSGSGKTHVAQAVVEALGAVRIRSDVERKRLAGLSPRSRAGSEPGGGIYSRELTERTYARLGDLAGMSLDAGYPVVVDATFLKRAQRDGLRAVARSHAAPCVILAAQAPESVLRERIVARAQHGRDASDADLAVLDGQLRSMDPLATDEQGIAVTVDTARALDPAWLVEAIRARGAGAATGL